MICVGIGPNFAFALAHYLTLCFGSTPSFQAKSHAWTWRARQLDYKFATSRPDMDYEMMPGSYNHKFTEMLRFNASP